MNSDLLKIYKDLKSTTTNKLIYGFGEFSLEMLFAPSVLNIIDPEVFRDFIKKYSNYKTNKIIIKECYKYFYLYPKPIMEILYPILENRFYKAGNNWIDSMHQKFINFCTDRFDLFKLYACILGIHETLLLLNEGSNLYKDVDIERTLNDIQSCSILLEDRGDSVLYTEFCHKYFDVCDLFELRNRCWVGMEDKTNNLSDYIFRDNKIESEKKGWTNYLYTLKEAHDKKFQNKSQINDEYNDQIKKELIKAVLIEDEDPVSLNKIIKRETRKLFKDSDN